VKDISATSWKDSAAGKIFLQKVSEESKTLFKIKVLITLSSEAINNNS
jgi:hypothetical protein